MVFSRLRVLTQADVNSVFEAPAVESPDPPIGRTEISVMFLAYVCSPQEEHVR